MSVQEATPPLHLDRFYAGEPFDEYARLRREEPVRLHEYDYGRLWAVTRHADVGTVARDPERFSSCVPLIPSPATDDLNVMQRGSLVVSDPPDHTTLRRATREYFSQRAVKQRRDAMVTYLDHAFEQVVEGEPFDLTTISSPFPISMIGEILGIPIEDRDAFTEMTRAALAFGDTSGSFGDTGMPALGQVMAFFAALREDRRSNPREDPVTGLLEFDEVPALISLFQLLLGGIDTTDVLICQGLVALLRRPELLDQLRSTPEMLPRAIEELLRWTTPINYFNRRTTTDVELGGHRIPAGEVVVLIVASANRDEAVFGPSAGSLDIDRDPNPHLSFGFGEHFCIGANLARLETVTFFEEFLSRFSKVELAGEPVRRPYFGQTNTLVELPITVRP